HQFKRALDQALMPRGSRDFARREDDEVFLRRLLAQRNTGRRQRLCEELPLPHPLPARRLVSCQRLPVRVERGSTIQVRGSVRRTRILPLSRWEAIFKDAMTTAA